MGIEEKRIFKIENLKLVSLMDKTLPDNVNKLNMVCLLSVHRGEEKDLTLICKKINSVSNLKFVVIPRHIHNSNYFLKVFNKDFRSVICSDFEPHLLENYDLIIINRFGVVNKILSMTKYTILGGTFINLGGHNILEPLFYSNKVLVGKYFYNVAREVEKGEKLGVVFRESALSNVEDFLIYAPKKIYETCQSFFTNIENPLNVIIDTVRKYL
jgi:3-deoxy-D-manno-octulosonic-acid transferase